MGGEIRRLEVLLCYNYQNGITNEEVVIFAIELELFLVGIIGLLETNQFVRTTYVENMKLARRLVLESKITRYRTQKGDIGNKYEPKVTMEDKVYLKTYYSHQPRSVVVDEILTKIKT